MSGCEGGVESDGRLKERLTREGAGTGGACVTPISVVVLDLGTGFEVGTGGGPPIATILVEGRSSGNDAVDWRSRLEGTAGGLGF